MSSDPQSVQPSFSGLPEDPGPNDALSGDEVRTGADTDPDTSPEALSALLEAEARDIPALESGALPPVGWAADAGQPDYAHTLTRSAAELTVPGRFRFGKAVFDLLCEANRFRPRGTNGLVAFGLRGGLLTGGDAQEGVEAVEIEDTRPDHVAFRCTLGIIDTGTGRVRAYAGSTVPNAPWMRNYFRLANGLPTEKTTRCNMLPTGCYIYRLGAHGGGRIDPALRMTDPDDLSADAKCTVLRTSNDLTFSHDDVWDPCFPYDNIHCAYSETSFSSAGCQTIKGADGQGPWGAFQRVIGGLGRGARIDYVLLTAREAAIAAAILDARREGEAALVEACLGRLRVGSEGEIVTALQRRLGFNGSAYFGPSTKKRLTEAEGAAGLATDGVYSPADDLVTGWGVFPAVAEGPEETELSLRLRGAGTQGWVQRDDVTVALRPDAGPGGVRSRTEVVVSKDGSDLPVGVQLSFDTLPGAGSGVGLEVTIRAVAVTEADPVPVPQHAAVRVGRLTAEVIDGFAPHALPGYRDALLSHGAAILGPLGIDGTARRLAHFLAQVGHESGGLRLRVESLNYTSPERLMHVWPGRFPTVASAEPFVRNEEALAEEVYGGRLGNSEPGDGFRYRGRGLIQITGRANYRSYSDRLGVDLEGDPDLAFEPLVALRIAAEYWNSRALRGERSMNALADADKLRAITYRINGGFTNFEAREAELDRAKALLGDPGVVHGDREIVDRGDFSDEVRLLQRLLVDRGFLTGTVDGKFGHGTYRALVAFKSRVGLEPLGYADAATLEALRAFAGEAEGALESGAALPRIGAEEEPVRHGISLLPEAGPGV